MNRLLLLSFIFLSMKVFAEKFNSDNNPANFNKIVGTQFITKFDSLPVSGRLIDDRLGWSETYWPSNKGGIAYRWSHPDPQPFKYKLHTLSELKTMSQDAVGELSPSELYDIAMSDYNYTLTKKVLSLYSSNALWWEGICHGWALAASNYPEPAQVVYRNKEGINVPFGSSDVKGLLAMHDAYNYQGIYAQVGKRCNASGKVPGEGDERDANPNPPQPNQANASDCMDVNAGSFHVVIANMLGIHSKSFVADVDRFGDIWNQPVTGFSSVVTGEEMVTVKQRRAGVERRIRIQTKFSYGEELKFYTAELASTGIKNFVSKLPVTGTPHQEFRHKDYEYIIEVNFDGDVVGGEWVTETRPDFLWAITRDRRFHNSPYPLAGLNFIYRPVKR
jgi:hypothetical protein